MLRAWTRCPSSVATAFTLRPVRDDDADALLALLTEPAVAEWWQEWDAQRVCAS